MQLDTQGTIEAIFQNGGHRTRLAPMARMKVKSQRKSDKTIEIDVYSACTRQLGSYKPALLPKVFGFWGNSRFEKNTYTELEQGLDVLNFSHSLCM